jgi:pilus assembly protein CpaB
MNLRNILIIMVALIVAGFTAMMARGWLLEQREAMRPKPVAEAPKAALPMVLVAKTHLKPGSFVQQGSLEWMAWPKEALNRGYIIKGERNLEDFLGAVTRATVHAGEPITDIRFVKPGDRGFMAAVLSPGNRAATVPISATTGNAGFIFPGDMVDVILTARYGDNNATGEGNNQYAATILENLRVLAIDQNTENVKGQTAVGRTATLEVTPRQAEVIALGVTMGQLSLSLRSLVTDQAVADQAKAESEGGKSSESVVVAEAAEGESQTAKPKQDKANSYVVDKDLKFMLQDRTKSNPGVTVLRGSAEK